MSPFIAGVLLTLCVAAVAQPYTPPAFPTTWTARIAASGNYKADPYTMWCDYKNGQGQSRVDMVQNGANLTMIWNFSNGRFYQLTSTGCESAPLRSASMAPLQNNSALIYSGTTTLSGIPVEIYYGPWTVPGPYYKMSVSYYAQQGIGRPVEIYFNPRPVNKNGDFTLYFYSTNFNSYDTFNWPVRSCSSTKASVKDLSFYHVLESVGVDACQFVA